MPSHRSKQNKKSLRKHRKSLRKDRKKLRSTRKNLRKSRKNTRRQEKPKKRSNRTLKLRKKNKQRGGNKPMMVPAAFKPASNPVYPPGGIYKPGSCNNGLEGGYYYGLDENGTTAGMRPAPVDTTGDPKSYNNNGNDPTQRGHIQSGGDPVSSLGGIGNIFRNIKYRIDNFSAKFNGEKLPTNPSPMDQPVNHDVFKQ